MADEKKLFKVTIDNITIEDDLLRIDRFKVAQQIFCMTTVGAKVDVRQYNELDVPFSFFAHSVNGNSPKAIAFRGIPNLR